MAVRRRRRRSRSDGRWNAVAGREAHSLTQDWECGFEGSGIREFRGQLGGCVEEGGRAYIGQPEECMSLVNDVGNVWHGFKRGRIRLEMDLELRA